MWQRNDIGATRRQQYRAVLSVAVLVLMAGLAACGQTISVSPIGDGSATTTSTQGGSSAGRGTITGDVLASPTCPVERAEDPCPGRPLVNTKLTVATPSGAIVATTITDAQGHFSIQVAPGSYVIHVQLAPGNLGMRQVSPGIVDVQANTTTSTQIDVDTGIR